MRRRRLLALVVVVGMLTLSGCLGVFGDNSIPTEQLNADPAGDGYAWNQTVDVHLTVRADSTFQGVYQIDDNKLTLYRRGGLSGRHPLNIRAVRYRYPNGTIINGTTLAARGNIVKTSTEVVITTPVEGGAVAFTASTTPKEFSLPTYIDGSYEVVLPPNRRASAPVFGGISPNPSRTYTDEQGRLHILWKDVTADSISIQFYLERDLALFGGLLAVLGAITLIGLAYFRRRLQRLRQEREELGLDVEN